MKTLNIRISLAKISKYVYLTGLVFFVSDGAFFDVALTSAQLNKINQFEKPYYYELQATSLLKYCSNDGERKNYLS